MRKLPDLRVHLSVPKTVDTAVYPVFQDATKKAIVPRGEYRSWVERLQKSKIFDGKYGSFQVLRFLEDSVAEHVVFLGLGAASELTEEKLRVMGGKLWAKLVAEKAKAVSIHLDPLLAGVGKKDVRHSRWVRSFFEGLLLSSYEFDKYKTGSSPSSSNRSSSKDERPAPHSIDLVTEDPVLKSEMESELAKLQSLCDAVFLTRDWSNEPSNVGTPIYYATEAKKLAKTHGLQCRILTEADAQKEKMGLLLGVGQGSERESRVVVLEYKPKGVKNPKTVALVGKGVTFDSGGISIKPALKMEDMKHDMTGAATVMGALLLAARWKVSTRVVGVLAFVENMPSGHAIQPGNVIASRAGKTVEIINTDAEGRLILADALDYAQDFKPDAVIDVATLTGAVSVALGKHCCGVLGNDENLIDSLRSAGDATGERLWPLPLFDEYLEDLKSDCADLKNSANDPMGGTIRGAIFLKQFIRKEVAWAHLDIASTAWGLGHLSYCPKKGASGSYVRTLAEFLANY
ncbi:MAG: leucyl aminopeptidase [Bdellovibrionia bacterium]